MPCYLLSGHLRPNGVANCVADHLGPDHIAHHLGPQYVADHLGPDHLADGVAHADRYSLCASSGRYCRSIPPIL